MGSQIYKAGRGWNEDCVLANQHLSDAQSSEKTPTDEVNAVSGTPAAARFPSQSRCVQTERRMTPSGRCIGRRAARRRHGYDCETCPDTNSLHHISHTLSASIQLITRLSHPEAQWRSG